MSAETVLLVAYPFAPVSPDAVGGAEQVLATLDAGLVAAGGRSLVLACPGSRVQGILCPTPPLPVMIDAEARRVAWAAVRESIAALAPEVDLVHLHGLDFAEYLPALRVPALVTLHLPLDWYPPMPGSVQLVCVSRAQRARGGAAFARVPVVENGVEVDTAPRFGKRDFALALGRICPEKGLHDAVEAARRAGLPLGIGGRVFPYPAHQAYLRDELAPRLDRQRRLLGVLAGARKRRLLASARCLVVASQAEETSSLVAMEALAAGTPVVARRVGALPDLVEHGRTGFLVDDVEEMAQAMRWCAALDPQVCRRAARARFSAGAMVADYLGLYRRLTRGSALAAGRTAPRPGSRSGLGLSAQAVGADRGR
jgi:glycosyltransferase involved in cell wall biosynthesis